MSFEEPNNPRSCQIVNNQIQLTELATYEERTPGSKNIKPDALSRIFDHSERPSFSEPIPEDVYFCSHMGDRVEGPHGLLRGNAPARMPTRSFICARLFKVRSHPMGSLFQGCLSSWSQSYHVSR